MDKVRCYFRDGKELGMVDVIQVEKYSHAITEVEYLLEQGGMYPVPTVLAVAK